MSELFFWIRTLQQQQKNSHNFFYQINPTYTKVFSQ